MKIIRKYDDKFFALRLSSRRFTRHNFERLTK